MSDSVTITISPEGQAVLDRLQTFPDARLCAEMDTLNEETIQHIQTTRLSLRGPETLGVIADRLRSSVRHAKATAQGTAIYSAIGTNVKYAGVHEYGIDEEVDVKAHTRSLRAGKLTRAAVRIAFASKGMTAPRSARIDVNVRAHKMHMKFPARAPIQRGIAERLPIYGTRLSQSIVNFYDGN